jgi:NAD(P)-dependent dehydrogenase (short-subunit alcohol dehydrogenase family)
MAHLHPIVSTCRACGLRQELRLWNAGAAGVLTVAADVSTAEGNKAMIDAAMAEFGEVHGLFANAGAFPLPAAAPGVPIFDEKRLPESVDETLLTVHCSFLPLKLCPS